MSKFRSPYDEDRIVPWLSSTAVVKPGEVVRVPDDLDAGFEEAGWERVLPARAKKGSES